MELREYQKQDLEKLRECFRTGKKAPLFVAPTGYGKTVLFCYVAAGVAARNKRVMILCHRAELIEQTVNALKRFNLRPGVVAAGYEPNYYEQVQVASVMTLRNRLHEMPDPDLIVIDEAHHSALKNTWGTILGHWPNALRLGVTATPIRLSGEGLSDIFDTLVCGPSTADLISMGYLSGVKVYAPSTPDLSGISRQNGDYATGELADRMLRKSITGDAITHYKKFAEGQKGVVFCVSVKHAQHVAGEFSSAGYRAAAVDGSLSPTERKKIIGEYRNGQIQILTSCDLVAEGFDVPDIAVGISLRPTLSTGLWLQQVGRCLRISSGKNGAIILDHAGNTYTHGLPTDERNWELTVTTEKRKKGKQEKEAAARVCKNCFAANAAAATVCTECNTVFEIKERKIEKVKGELAEITKIETAAKKKEQGSALGLEALIALGKHRGYKNPYAWASYVLAGRTKKRRYGN